MGWMILRRNATRIDLGFTLLFLHKSCLETYVLNRMGNSQCSDDVIMAFNNMCTNIIDERIVSRAVQR